MSSSIFLPIDVNVTNALKYFFEVIVVGFFIIRINVFLGRHYTRKLLNETGHVTIRTHTIQSSLFHGAPPTLFARFLIIFIHIIMLVFEFSFGGASHATGLTVAVQYPYKQRTSGLSSPIWADAALYCCADVDGHGRIECNPPAILSNHVHAFSPYTLWLNKTDVGCVGEALGKVRVKHRKTITVFAFDGTAQERYNKLRNCAWILKDGVNVTVCNTPSATRDDVFLAFLQASIPQGRDVFVEFSRHYLPMSLWQTDAETDFIRERGVALAYQYTQTVISPTVVCIVTIPLILLVSWLVVRAQPDPVVDWGLGGLVGVLYEQHTEMVDSPSSRCNSRSEVTGITMGEAGAGNESASVSGSMRDRDQWWRQWPLRTPVGSFSRKTVRKRRVNIFATREGARCPVLRVGVDEPGEPRLLEDGEAGNG